MNKAGSTSISRKAVYAVLFVIAVIISTIIYILDSNTPDSLAIGVLYSVVILYSWIFPQRLSAVYAAVVCSALVLLAPVSATEPIEGQIPTARLNQILAMISIWISASLVMMAKRSFRELEININSMENQVKSKTKSLKQLNQTLEERVKNRTAELNNKNKELEQFVYVASHDFQEPLNTINNFIELLDDEYKNELDEEGRKYLEFISQSSTRLMTLIRALLQHSRIGQDQKQEDINLSELINEVLMDLFSVIKSTHAVVKYDNLPAIRGSHIDMYLLFQNLISNAIKFHRHGVVPEVNINCTTSGDNYVFSIQDNGIGIAEDKRDKIFTIFKRLHHADKFEGTGIGLANCKKIVNMYKGDIWVDSNPYEGSTFYVMLPK